jgi:hypothetical protein
MVTATRKTDAYLDEDEDFEDGVCKPGENAVRFTCATRRSARSPSTRAITSHILPAQPMQPSSGVVQRPAMQ